MTRTRRRRAAARVAIRARPGKPGNADVVPFAPGLARVRPKEAPQAPIREPITRRAVSAGRH